MQLQVFLCVCFGAVLAFNSVSCASTAKCTAAQVKINTQCYALRNPKDACEHSQQCTGGSKCTKRFCTCPSTLPTVVNNICTARSNAIATAEVAEAEVVPVEVAEAEVVPVEVAEAEVVPVEVAEAEGVPVEVAEAEVAPVEAPTVCSDNAVLIGGSCMPKTSDGRCLQVNCLASGNAGCVNWAPYSKCQYNSEHYNYLCCQQN